jgi:MFS transporter, FSR family, fosmidomycin resistance protein
MTSTTADTPIDRRGPERSYLDLWLITTGHAFTHWYPATFYVLLPLIGNELGLSYVQIGSLLAIQHVAGAICNVPGGLIVDTVGRKGLLMAISLAWIGLPYLIMGFVDAYWMLLTCSALVGIGNNFWHPTAIPLLGNLYPSRRGLMMSFHAMAGNVGDALAPLAAGALLVVLSWRNLMVLNVLPGALMAVVLLVYFAAPQPGDAPAGAKRGSGQIMHVLRTLLHNKTVTMLCIGSTFRTMTQISLLTFLPVFLANELGYSAFLIGACLFGLQAAGFAATPVAGYLSDRIGRRQIIVFCLGASMLLLVFMGFAGRSMAFVFFVAFLGFFLFAVRAVLQAWMLDAAPQGMAGTSIGLMFGMQSVGAAIGPVVGGLIADRYGLGATFYFLAITILVANLFMFFTPVPERPAQVRASGA